MYCKKYLIKPTDIQEYWFYDHIKEIKHLSDSWTWFSVKFGGVQIITTSLYEINSYSFKGL